MNKIVAVVIGIVMLSLLGFGTWFLVHKKTGTNFQQSLSRADMMEIEFTPKDETRSYKKVVTYQPQVWLLRSMISSKSVSANSCGYEGTVQFFAQGKPLFDQPAAFNLTPQCSHIAFSFHGKIYRRVLLQEGVNYLKDILEEIKTQDTP